MELEEGEEDTEVDIGRDLRNQNDKTTRVSYDALHGGVGGDNWSGFRPRRSVAVEIRENPVCLQIRLLGFAGLVPSLFWRQEGSPGPRSVWLIENL
jgi:hypothetical protein